MNSNNDHPRSGLGPCSSACAIGRSISSIVSISFGVSGRGGELSMARYDGCHTSILQEYSYSNQACDSTSGWVVGNMAALQMRSEKRQGRRGLPGEPLLHFGLLILLLGHSFCLLNWPDSKRSAHGSSSQSV
jgi:hypothetical protein